jgi:SPP1 family predicted phage head-tail adaptor
MDIGRLNKRISFLKTEEGKNDLKQTVKIPEPYRKLWASVEPTNAKDLKEAERSNDIIEYTVYIRYREDITGDMIINYSGKRLEILYPPINVKEEGVLLKILCKYKVGDLIV